MALKIEHAPRAELDLERQYVWYVKHATLDVAERYLKAFDISVNTLALRPEIGAVRKYRLPSLAGVRAFPLQDPFEVHLIFYWANESKLSIVRVIHGARDLPRRLAS